ncbi:MAG: transporter [bacterium]
MQPATRRRTILAFVAVSTFVYSAALKAQSPDSDPRAVQPERPTVATHAHTVAPGYIEIEAGTQGDRIAAGKRAYFAPIVTKLGLGSHLQLNLTTPVVFRTLGQSNGLGDVSVGLKWRLLDDHEWLGDFAILPAVKFPSGSLSGDTGTGSTDVSITAISSHAFGGVAMDINAIYTRLGSARDGANVRDASNAALWTASFGFPVLGNLSWAVELFGQPTIDGTDTPSTAALLFGPTYLVSPALNLDVGFIAPFHGDMPNSLYAGVVWNVGRLFSPEHALRRHR